MATENEQPGTWASQSPRSTKSSAAGSSTSPKRRGPWLVGLWILSCAFEAQATPRTLWLFQQMGRVPAPRAESHVVQLETDLDHIGDTPSLGVRLSAPVGPVEVRAKGSQRLFLDITDAGRSRHNEARANETALALEIARQFYSARGHYGRFAVELLSFRPSTETFVGFLVHTGVVESPSSPWSVGLSLQVRLATIGTESNLGLSGESERVVWENAGGKIRLGAMVGWSHRLKDGPGVVPTEHGVFTVGPTASWDSGWGELKARLGFRLWLDRDVTASQTALLSEFDPPALNVFWTYRL